MSSKPVAAGKSSFDLIDPEVFFAHLELHPGARVVDAASGAGRYSVEIAGRLGGTGAVHAVDSWEEGIESLRSLVRREGLGNIHPVVADITRRLPLPDGSIDICLMATILHDLPAEGREAALDEAAKVLKPGGLLAVVEFRRIDHGPGPPQAVRIAESEAEALIGRHGFRRVNAVGLGEFTYLVTFRKPV